TGPSRRTECHAGALDPGRLLKPAWQLARPPKRARGSRAGRRGGACLKPLGAPGNPPPGRAATMPHGAFVGPSHGCFEKRAEWLSSSSPLLDAAQRVDVL